MESGGGVAGRILLVHSEGGTFWMRVYFGGGCCSAAADAVVGLAVVREVGC